MGQVKFRLQRMVRILRSSTLRYILDRLDARIGSKTGEMNRYLPQGQNAPENFA
jgi:hypothetical protein